jgi:mRNA interferase RelE/StbE
MYKVKLTVKAVRELKKLSKENKLSIGEIIEELRENPLIGKLLDRELIRRFSYRIGVYRLIYTVNKQDKIVIIISAGHRNTVYN